MSKVGGNILGDYCTPRSGVCVIVQGIYLECGHAEGDAAEANECATKNCYQHYESIQNCVICVLWSREPHNQSHGTANDGHRTGRYYR